MKLLNIDYNPGTGAINSLHEYAKLGGLKPVTIFLGQMMLEDLISLSIPGGIPKWRQELTKDTVLIFDEYEKALPSVKEYLNSYIVVGEFDVNTIVIATQKQRN